MKDLFWTKMMINNINKYIISMKKEKYLIAILIIFGMLFSSISLVNHYNFRTFAFDFGLFNNAIYDYAHLSWNDASLFLPDYQVSNKLADHFSLFLMLLSPLYWLFGSYALLIVQIIGILWGGFGIYTYIRHITENKALSLCAIMHFYLTWGIYSALAFGYHDNVMAAMFVPWFIYYVHLEKWKLASLYFILIIITKENMALWIGFISLGLLFLFFKEKTKIKPLSIYCLISFIYFITVVKLMIPLVADEGTGYIHFGYTALGENMLEAVKTILTRPQHVFTLLFENHLAGSQGYGIKTELHFAVLLSGGFVLFYRPEFLVMLLPIFAQKLFNDVFTRWGLNYQYSIEFVPILTIALYYFINKYESKNKKLLIAFIALSLTTAVTFKKLEGRVSKWYKPANSQFYKKEHYSRHFDTGKVYDVLKLIPTDASVSAQNTLVPHLSFRKKIYLYPYVGDANYIALIPSDIMWRLTAEEYEKKITEYKNNKKWKIFHETSDIIVFIRVGKN